MCNKISFFYLIALFFFTVNLGGCAKPEQQTATLIATKKITAPRLLRFISSEEPFSGKECFGVVHSDKDGIPISIVNMGSIKPSFCINPRTEIKLALVKEAFEVADKLSLHEILDLNKFKIEEISDLERSNRILSPVPISLNQIESNQRFVIGVGLNYKEHKKEVGLDDLIIFPKFTATSGAYQEVQNGLQIEEDKEIILLDYEIELAMVFLDEINLSALPTSLEDFNNSIAYFISNDISDRKPIILDKETGYTKGKSNLTYLPTGPWMIHGKHINVLTRNQTGSDNLKLELRVLGKGNSNVENQIDNGLIAQQDFTSSMIYGPMEILTKLSSNWRKGENQFMPDRYNISRNLHKKNGIIPAGSVLLTGTPGGTAITTPSLWQQIVLFVKGGFSMQGAKKRYALESEKNSKKLGYLQPGDVVESRITGLGRQRWQVVSSK